MLTIFSYLSIEIKLHIEFRRLYICQNSLGTNNFYFVIQSILKDQEFENWKNNNYGSLALPIKIWRYIIRDKQLGRNSSIYYLKLYIFKLYLLIIKIYYYTKKEYILDMIAKRIYKTLSFIFGNENL